MNKQSGVSPLEHDKRSQIIRINAGTSTLSKEQQTFNKLVRKIEKLKQQILDDKERLDRVLSLYLQDILPRLIQISQAKIRISHLLDEKRSLVKLSPLQNEKVDTMILLLLNDAFCITEPDAAALLLHKKYSSPDMDVIFANLEEFNNKGFEESDDEYDEETDEYDKEEPGTSYSRSGFSEQQPGNKTGKTRPKTRKQQESERLRKQKEELQSKSLRSIYLSLVRLLHPDKETDEDQKTEKEEQMKEVIRAYEKRDLYGLLELEIKWIKNHKEHISAVEENTLSIYLDLMKKQVKNLEQELDTLWLHPQYRVISGTNFWIYLYSTESFNETLEHYDKLIETLHKHIHDLQINKRNSSTISECIRKFFRYRDMCCSEGTGRRFS